MKNFIITILSFVLLWGCSQTSNKESNPREVRIEADAREFLAWYIENHRKLISLNRAVVQIGPDGYYYVNKDSLLAYSSFLTQSGKFTTKLIREEKRKFEVCKEDLKSNQINDGVPRCVFQADPITKLQEDLDDYTQNISDKERTKIDKVEFENQTAKVAWDLEGWVWLFFEKENGSWKISQF